MRYFPYPAIPFTAVKRFLLKTSPAFEKVATYTVPELARYNSISGSKPVFIRSGKISQLDDTLSVVFFGVVLQWLNSYLYKFVSASETNLIMLSWLSRLKTRTATPELLR